MDKKLKGKIINASRRLTYSYQPRTLAKKAQQVAPATFKCKLCPAVLYEGKKELSKTDLKNRFPNIVAEKLKLDHIEPVIPITGFKTGEWDWNEYYDRMFVEQDGWQGLCKECHDKKSDEENKLRRLHKKSVDK